MLNQSVCNPYCYTEKWGSMVLKGEGSLKAEPNRASVNLGVITENISVAAAQKENGAKSNEVINSLYAMGVPKNNISTAYYNVEPQYDYVEGKQILKGYRVSNVLLVTISNLSKLGEIIDTATENGANYVYNIKFTAASPSMYYQEALKLAIINVVKKAEEVCKTLGVFLDEVPFKITEVSYEALDNETMLLKGASQATPILPGQINITARVEAVFTYRDW